MSKKTMSLSEQLKIQKMYSDQIMSGKSDKEVLQDKLSKANDQLKKLKKKPIIKNKEG